MHNVGAAARRRTWRHDVQMLDLAAFSDTPSPSVTRLVFTDRDMEARRSAASPESCAAMPVCLLTLDLDY